MVVFIDESGCPGIKLGKGSTPYFTVTMLVFEDHDEALRCEAGIVELRRALRLPDYFEFHFNKLCHDYREAFLRKVAAFESFYFSITINKAKLFGEGFKYPDSFYKWVCGLLFENAKPYLSNASVVIDGSGGRQFRTQLSAYLRKRVNTKGGPELIRKVKIQDSRSNDLLQMVDMICGAVARCYSGKEEARHFRKLISHREMMHQYWPK
jgi:hypothetical protein